MCCKHSSVCIIYSFILLSIEALLTHEQNTQAYIGMAKKFVWVFP